MCPVCTVTVIAGLGISRIFGIDDLITSIWIGGFALSFSFVLINWIKKKKPEFPISNFQFPVIALTYLLILVPLKLNHSIGISRNTFLGIDKIVLGISVGSIVFLLGVFADKKQRIIYKKQWFKFQKVVFPVFALLVASIVFWFVL